MVNIGHLQTDILSDCLSHNYLTKTWEWCREQESKLWIQKYETNFKQAFPIVGSSIVNYFLDDMNTLLIDMRLRRIKED